MNTYVRVGGYWRVQPISPHVTFESLWGKSMQAVCRRVRDFQDNEEFYLRNALAHELKFGLVGSTGCGKTAAVHAIANQLGRHVILLPCSEIIGTPDNIWEILDPSYGRNQVVSKELVVSDIDLPRLSEAIIVFEGFDELRGKIQTRRQMGPVMTGHDEARENIFQFLSVPYDKCVAVVVGQWASALPPGLDFLSMSKPTRDDVIAKLDSFFGEGGGDVIRANENWVPTSGYNAITNKIVAGRGKDILSYGCDRKLLKRSADAPCKQAIVDAETKEDPVIELDEDDMPRESSPNQERTDSDGNVLDIYYDRAPSSRRTDIPVTEATDYDGNIVYDDDDVF